MWTTTAQGDTSRSNHVKYVWNNSYHITFIIHNPVEALISFSGFFFPIAWIGKFTAMIILHFRSNQSINQSINQSHRTSWRHDWLRGLGALNSSPLSGLFTSVSVGSSTRFYRFTSATGRIGVYTILKYDKKPIRYLMLHVWDRRGAASLRHRNRAATKILKFLKCCVCTRGLWKIGEVKGRA